MLDEQGRRLIERGTRVALLSAFPSRFVLASIIPELERRGLDVVFCMEPQKLTAARLLRGRVSIALHMTEMIGHSISANLSRTCHEAGVSVRAISRKKATWTFLPEPMEVVMPDAQVSGMVKHEAPGSALPLKKPEAPVLELQQLVALYEQESRSQQQAILELTEQSKKLEGQLKSAKQMLATARTSNQVLEAARVLIKAKLFSVDEVAKRLVTLLETD